MTFLRLTLVFVCLFWAVNPSEARIVALLFDDSGSMRQKDSLPAFGAQLLVSTLDGKRNGDRFFYAKLSQLDSANYGVTEFNLSTESHIRNSVNIVKSWAAGKNNTPADQILSLIEQIGRVQKPNEEAFLVILTDGAFTNRNGEQLPNNSPILQSIEESKSLLNGPLRVDFMVMGPNAIPNGSKKTVAEIAEDQGIRRSLLETHNNDATDGKTDVSSAEDMLDAFKSIIAKVSATERDGQKRYISRSSNQITIRSPLAIKRIVSVSFGKIGERLAKPDTSSLNALTSFSVLSSMRSKDFKAEWRGEQLQSETTHFVMQPPLPAGTHRLIYNRDPSEVFILFQTAADLKLTLIDDKQKEFPVVNGVYQVPKDATATVVHTVYDTVGTNVRQVPIDSFDSAVEFRSYIKSSDTPAPLKLKVITGKNIASSNIDTKRIGSYKIQSSMRVKGFVSTYASPISMEVIDTKAQIGLAFFPKENCRNCSNDQVKVTLLPGTQSTEIGTLEVEGTSNLPGTINVTIDGEPASLKLEPISGTAADGSLALSGGVSTSKARYGLSLIGSPAEILLNNKQLVVNFTATAKGGVNGTKTLARNIELVVPTAELIYSGNSQDPSGVLPLSLDAPLGLLGQETLDFVLVNSVVPLKPEDITIGNNSNFIAYSVLTDGTNLSIWPKINFLCGCFTAIFDQGDHEIVVSWEPDSKLQSTTSSITYKVRIPWQWQGVIECLKILFIILLIIYILYSLSKWFRAFTFPSKSIADLYYNQNDPIARRLAGWNFTFLKSFIPFYGVPNQRKRVEGVQMIASRGGVLIVLKKTDKSLLIETLAQRVSELVEDQPNTTTYKLSWGDSIERTARGNRMRMTLRENASDRYR